MAIWHPSLTFYQDPCVGLWWEGLLKNPTGLYPSLTTPGQLDAGCYWYDPKLITPCWAPAFYQCRDCCCKPVRCGIPDEITMTVSGFSGTLTSIDYSSDYGYSPSRIADCSTFWQKNCDTTVYPFHDCWRLPPHSAVGCWFSSGDCCSRDRDTFFWWPRDSFRGTQESTGADLCARSRQICYRWPNLCSSTGHGGATYTGVEPPRWIMTCEPCCGWDWFYWEDKENKTDKRTVIGAGDCPANRRDGYNYRSWYSLYREFKYTTPDGDEIDTIRWGYQDPIYIYGFRTYLWPPGWRGLSSRNLNPLVGVFWNSWHIDHLGMSRSPYYENCVGGLHTKSFFNTFPREPRDGGYEDWCDNFTYPSANTYPYWIYKRPPLVLLSQPSVENCHYCWSGVTNLLNYSTDGHCNGTCNVNMQDFNNTIVARSAVYLRPPNFNLRLIGRNRVPGSANAHFLYMVDNPGSPWSYQIDYPCHPKIFSPACACMVCNISPGLAAPKLAPFYLDLTGYGAKIGFDMRIYCAPMASKGEAGYLWNGGWWYIDNVWIEQDTNGERLGGFNYAVGDRFRFDYYETPRRGGELFYPTESGIFFQEARVAEVNNVGAITKIELVQHVPRWGQGALDEYPEDFGIDEPIFSPGLGTGIQSNVATKIVFLNVGGNQPPGAPTNVTVSPLPAGVRVTFSAPTNDGGSAIVGYKIYLKRSNGEEISRTVESSPADLTDLDGSTTYIVTVVAINGLGEGDRTGEVSVTTDEPTPGRPPNAPPAGVAYSIVSPGLYEVRWVPNMLAVDDDPITSYMVQFENQNTLTLLERMATPPATSLQVNLDPSQTYILRVRQANRNGVSPWSPDIVINPQAMLARPENLSEIPPGEKTAAEQPVLKNTNPVSPVTTLITSSFVPVYENGDAYVAVDPEIAIEGNAYVQITSAIIRLQNAQVGDILELSEGWMAGNRRVRGEYDQTTGTFRLFNPATRDEYELALQAINYRFDGQDATLGGTRSSLNVTFQVSAVDMSARGVDLSPIILNLGCGRFFRQFRPPLYARVLNHRYAVAVPGTNYIEGDVIQWDAEMNPPSGLIDSGYKFNPYWDVTTTPRRYARATVAEVDSEGGIIDWYMCGAANQFTHPATGAYNPSRDADTGFWPDIDFDWFPSSYEFWACGNSTENKQGDYYDIAYANRCDYCYEGYMPLRYSWSGMGDVLSKNFNGYCDHTWAKFNFRVEQISVKTDINVIDPPGQNGRKAKLRLVDVDEAQTFYDCEITPVRWVNGEEAPGPNVHVLQSTVDSYRRYYRAHDIPVKQGSITNSSHIAIIDSGAGYYAADGVTPIPLNTWNGTINLVNVNDDLRGWMYAAFGFYAWAHFFVSRYTAEGGIAAITVVPEYPGYWYFVQQDSGEVWFNTVSTDWYFEMAWPSDSLDPLYDDPSPDCRGELSAQVPCCHATRDNWGYLAHYDGFPEPFQTSMYGYQRTIRIFNPETDAMWWGEDDYVDAVYTWQACGYGASGWPYGSKPNITGSPGYSLAGDISKRWSIGSCPDFNNKVYRMILIHPCAACAWEQALPGGQTCESPGGLMQNNYSPSAMEPAFTAAGAGPQWNNGSGQAWITSLGGASLNVRIQPLYATPPVAGEEGDI